MVLIELITASMNRFVLAVVCAASAVVSAQPAKVPPTKTVDAADTFFGKTYKDPYRWLEKLGDKDVAAWFKANADVTDALLATIPGRDMLAKEWNELDKLEPASFSGFVYASGRMFYKKTLGGENVGKLFYRQGWSGKEQLLFDPATYKPGVVTTIASAVPSWDGKYVALDLSSGGAEYAELRVLDVAKGALLPGSVNATRWFAGWTKDSKGFLYDVGKVTDTSAIDIELNRKTKLHLLGTDFATDREVFSNEANPDLGIEAKELPLAGTDETTPDIVFGWVYTVQNEIRLYTAPAADLAKKTVAWKPLVERADSLVKNVVIDGDYAYAATYVDAPKFKLVRTPWKHPDWKKAEAVVAEAADTLQNFSRSKSDLWLAYSNGIVGRIVKFDLKTKKTTEVKLPTTGTADITCPDAHSNRCIVTVASWISPNTLYEVDGDKDTVAKSVFNSDVVYPGFDQLTVEEVEVPSHDGAMVPLSIIHRKDMKLDGSNSVLLEGYGSYGYSLTPWFSVRTSVALHHVVVAYAHVRGGGEKGQAWYKAGFKTTKPNTWKDFIACGNYLVTKGYTTKARLTGTGTSAGGILISRAITERPDLFAAAVVNVGVANALRAEYSPNGPVNAPEFGTVKDETEAKALAEMDGVAHVTKNTAYPAVMGVGGWNDPRVSAWQPGKFVAAVQAASSSKRPVLMKVNYDNGHFTEEKTVTFKNFAGQYAFLLWQTGHKEFQPAK
jgi:prolyl oligopeptidase